MPPSTRHILESIIAVGLADQALAAINEPDAAATARDSSTTHLVDECHGLVGATIRLVGDNISPVGATIRPVARPDAADGVIDARGRAPIRLVDGTNGPRGATIPWVENANSPDGRPNGTEDTLDASPRAAKLTTRARAR